MKKIDDASKDEILEKYEKSKSNMIQNEDKELEAVPDFVEENVEEEAN